MTEEFAQSRTLRVLVADPATDSDDCTAHDVDGVELVFCSTAREALRHADEPLDYLLLSTSISGIAFQDVAQMFASTADDCGLIVVSNQADTTEEAIARQLGAVMYRERSSDLSWLSQLKPRRIAKRGHAPEWTLDWHRRPPRRAAREADTVVSQS